MPRQIDGQLRAEGFRFAIVLSRWNAFITERLLEGALDAIRRTGGDVDSTLVVRVPGAYELPMIAERLAARSDVDAVVALGVLIRGATPHFDYIAAEATKGLASAAMASGKPVAFGVLTTDTIEQAIERAGTKAGNKGHEAALAAIEMADLYRQLDDHVG
ncbi:MAG: 6,7-dimethyl-8-ribityllumazine synthase [Deltaproteobacteria bacterium]|nr:MAG: 6,7-dimethyl-8-ribityllumazine synthase [Deltaproteobacteria bacterium]